MERRSRRGDDDEDRGSRRSGRDRDSEDRGSSSRRGGSRRFEYHQRSADDVKKRESMSNSRFDQYTKDGVTAWKVNDKDNTIRILPPTWDEPTHYGYDVWLHYGVGPDEQTYLCLNKMKGEPCPICEEHAKARKDGDEEYARQLAPGRRVMVYIVDRDNEKAGVQVWGMPASLDQAITKISTDRRSGEVFPLDSPEDGFDVMFEKTGTGIGTKYVGAALDRRPSPLGKDAWLDYAVDNPLPSVLQYYSYEHIAEQFGGGSRQRDTRGGGDDDRKQRDSGRGRDRDSGRRSQRDEEALSWDSVHSMSGKELEALVDDKRLNIAPDAAEDDDELADWICEALGISKPSTGRRRVVDDDDDAEESPSEKLRKMRNRSWD